MQPPPPPGLTEYFVSSCWAAGVGLVYGGAREYQKLRLEEHGSTVTTGTSPSAAPTIHTHASQAAARAAGREHFSRLARAATHSGYFFGSVAAAFGMYRLGEVVYGGFHPVLYSGGGILATLVAAGLRGKRGVRLRTGMVLSGPLGVAAYGVGWIQMHLLDLVAEVEARERLRVTGGEAGLGEGVMMLEGKELPR